MLLTITIDWIYLFDLGIMTCDLKSLATVYEVSYEAVHVRVANKDG